MFRIYKNSTRPGLPVFFAKAGGLISASFFILMFMAESCSSPASPENKPVAADSGFAKGSFGYDLAFLQKHDSVIVLSDAEGRAKIIVSPKYQGKVFTSTAFGDSGTSFGWVNYKAFSGPQNAHMNGYGGENRFWLGPEGGKYSLFFPKDSPMVFDHWKTPAAFDTEAWGVKSESGSSVTLTKKMQLSNYTGATLEIDVNRSISLLPGSAAFEQLGISDKRNVLVVGYQAVNTITNAGKTAWTDQTGMPCIWMLDMFNPSDRTVILVPYKNASDTTSKIATSDYFGAIPPDRLKHKDGMLYFRADGKSRGKLGLAPDRATPFAGSYDARNNILTVAHFDVDPGGKYLNQEWKTDRPVYAGDAVNAYNDGPLADGSQMGPFYEIESVSPAAKLKPGESLTHHHSVFHFTGPEAALDSLSRQIFHVSLDEVRKAF